MAEKASGKAQGRSRPQTQSKNQNRSGQQKRNPEAGRGGGGRGAANGAARQKGRAPETSDRPGRGQEEQVREQSQQAEGPGESGVGGKLMAWHMAKLGHRTAMAERRWIGGSCPNIACLPSKNGSGAPRSSTW